MDEFFFEVHGKPILSSIGVRVCKRRSFRVIRLRFTVTKNDQRSALPNRPTPNHIYPTSQPQPNPFGLPFTVTKNDSVSLHGFVLRQTTNETLLETAQRQTISYKEVA